MRVEALGDRYELVAPLYGRAPDELRRRDHGPSRAVHRWVALTDDDRAVGCAHTWVRPDDRRFLIVRGDDPSVVGPLAAAADASSAGPLHTHADLSDDGRLAALRAAGFRTEVVVDAFRVRFDRVIAALARARMPSTFEIVTADRADPDRLFALDIELRRDVPGTDGWRGDRAMFDADFADAPPFDPAAYLVAVERRTGTYAGLARIWRNPGEPRFGLAAVARPYRMTFVGPALIRLALLAASQWGSDTFVTETSPSNTALHRRMALVGAELTGRFVQMVRR